MEHENGLTPVDPYQGGATASTNPPPAYTAQAQGGPPPPQGAGYGQQEVVVHQPPQGVQVPIRYASTPQQMICVHCQAQIVTDIKYKSGSMTWIACTSISVMGILTCFPVICIGCQFIPFCMKAFKDVEHSCPNCHQVLGVHDRVQQDHVSIMTKP